MSQEQTTAQKSKFGLILVISVFILGIALFVLSQVAKNENINTETITKQPTVEATIPETPTESVETEALTTTEPSKYEVLPEPAGTPSEINNDTLNELDNDMKTLESSSENVSDLGL